MTEVQYKTLCELCDNVLNKDQFGSEVIAMPWLHVIREHPVFLAQYEELFVKQDKQSFFVFIKVAFINLILGLIEIFRNFKDFKRRDKSDVSNLRPMDFLFVSHLINLSDVGKKDDFYFSNLPEELYSNGCVSHVALLNQTQFSCSRLDNKWGDNHVQRSIFVDFIGITKELKLLFSSIKLSYKLYKSIKGDKSDLENKILFKSSLKAFECIPNLRLGYQLEELVKKGKPRFLVTTYEGHALERILFERARKINREIKCIGYQHALVFKFQHAIRRNLASDFNPDFIFTSGEIGKYQLLNSPQLNGVKIDVLGSNRGSNKNSEIRSEKLNGNKFTCLVIPEALPIECDLLFNISLECALKNINLNFIWRLHPLMNFKELLNGNTRYKNLPSNIILSENSLDEDISNSGFVLYRGSTAVVKAVLNGLIPIYFGQESEMTIDPLYEQYKGKHVITNAIDLNLVFAKGYNSQDHLELKNYCTRLFSEFDINKLVKLT